MADARLYLEDPDDGIGGAGAFFLLLDEPEVYGLPPDPVVTTRDLPRMWRHVGRRGAAWPLRAPGRRPAGGGRDPGAAPAGERAAERRRPQEPRRRAADGARAEFRSYYGRPVLKEPVWEAPDVAGYLFLGGLAGASSVLAAGAELTGRAELARVAKTGGARRDRPVRRALWSTTWAGRSGSSTCCACSSPPRR